MQQGNPFAMGSKVRRRRKHDRSEVPVSFLPTGNRPARIAYLFAVFGLLPGVGLFTGPFAIGFGIVGFRRAKRDEEQKGIGHAFASQVMGLFQIACSAIGFACLFKSFG
jgi:hypothetical protein